jgi:hypothetical protein
MRTWSIVSGLSAGIFALACGGTSSSGSSGAEGVLPTDTGLTGGGSEDGASGGPRLDSMQNDTGGTAGDGGDGGCGTPPPASSTVTGTVYAPNLEIPISGALVYTTNADPEPIPDEVYCAECVSLPCDAHFTFTNADGTFSLPANEGATKLVVQKGQFLRVSPIDLAPGNNPVAPNVSSLPGVWNPAGGMWIPRIAVAYTGDDQIENVLAKIGLGQTDANGNLIPGTEMFDHLQSADAQAMLDDPAWLDDYHIVFIPCMSQGGLGAPSTGRVDNIRDYVASGGKWYVTDWANEYLYEPFPNYQTFHTGGFGGDADLSSYDSLGAVVDGGLLAWLQALPPELKDIGGGAPTLNQLPQVEFTHNWSGIDDAPPVWTQDAMGMQVDVGHHVWAQGPCGACSNSQTIRPMTMTATYGCGRMMFSTYHTTGTDQPNQRLTPQELVLLYTILEIGVCFGEPPPPPPPID